MLLRYFGEKNEHNCGHCDVCLQKHGSHIRQGEYQDIKEQVLHLLKNGPLSTVELTASLPTDKEKVEKVVSFLLSEEIIHLQNGLLSI